MGIFRTLRGIVNSEVMGEEIVKKIIDVFNETSRYSPGDDRHELLAKTYISRLVARGENINEETIALESLSQTHIFSLLPEGKDIKAMALHILNQERPDIIQAYPKFGLEYMRLMEPVMTSDT
jgi:hypothetical protein